MEKIINRVFFYLKIVFIIVAFSLTLYLMLMRMDYFGKNLLSTIPVFIPLLLVLFVFILSFFLNRGNDNMFFNIGCVLALIAIIIIGLRTILDKNIIASIGSQFNLGYFEYQIIKIKIMLYLIFVGNILLLYNQKKSKTQ